MNQRLQIYFFLKKSKTTKKGTTPIVCRLSIHPKRVEFYTGLSIDESQWNNNASRVIGKKDTAKGINSQIDAIESRIRQIYASLIVKDNSINVLAIYAAYSGKNRKRLCPGTSNRRSRKRNSCKCKKYKKSCSKQRL
ncbi:MAG: hypothetical protein EBV82_09980 [Chitinophagia bacterium]|nr:hypothetical protein [Chitinophagia bacterium]